MKKPMSEDMTFHEAYGELPTALFRTVRRFNVSPADWYGLEYRFGTDWEAMRECIVSNIVGTSFSAFKAGV